MKSRVQSFQQILDFVSIQAYSNIITSMFLYVFIISEKVREWTCFFQSKLNCQQRNGLYGKVAGGKNKAVLTEAESER